MTLFEFNNYMNIEFDKLIEKICPKDINKNRDKNTK